jgi:hypothetical protein
VAVDDRAHLLNAAAVADVAAVAAVADVVAVAAAVVGVVFSAEASKIPSQAKGLVSR